MSLLLPWVSTNNYLLAPDCISCSNLVLIIHYTILTLPREIDLLWGRRYRVAVLLYFMAHYSFIIFELLILVLNTIVMPTEVNLLFMCDIILAADNWFQSVTNLSYHCNV